MKLKELKSELDKLPTWRPARLKGGQLVKDPSKFISSHFKILEANPGNRTYLPYFKRLERYYRTQKDRNIDKS